MAEISVLIPCLNEAKNLPALLERLERVCLGADLDVETLVLDDASEDDTLAVAQGLRQKHKPLNIRVVHRFEPRRGFGALIRYGLAHATGRYCLLMTADGAHPLEDLPRFVAEARKGAQLVQTSRYERDQDSDNIPGRFKRYQDAFRGAVRAFLGWDVRDPTCSFKLVDRTFLLAVGVRANNLSLIPEIVFKTHLAGGKIVFVPGKQSFREKGISQFHFLREATSYAYVLFRAWLHQAGALVWF
ncbi:MAG: glycosyltransferase family 2 protein [Elusimicrobia bacterium]|nr:glycosyltransferase family 2 protein [Elusimicrobiota bacterium]